MKTPIKKVTSAFFRNCLRMQKPQIKFVKFGRWDIPQSGLLLVPGGGFTSESAARRLQK
jgi:hypothetical protein